MREVIFLLTQENVVVAPNGEGQSLIDSKEKGKFFDDLILLKKRHRGFIFEIREQMGK